MNDEQVIGEVQQVNIFDNSYVRIPMMTLAYESDFYLTDDEFVVFYEIGFHASARNMMITRTTVDMLACRLDWEEKNKSRGKTRIKKAIEGLVAKKYIVVHCDDEKIKNNSYLTIETIVKKTGNVYGESIKSGSSVFSGYTEVREDITELARKDMKNVGQRLKVLVHIKWREKINYTISYNEWKNVLNISERTAIRLITEMIEDGAIYCQSGKYYTTEDGQVRQERNKYSTEVSKKEDKEYEMGIVAQEKKSRAVTNLLEKTSDIRMWTRMNIFDRGMDLGEEDMEIYLTTDCDVVRREADKRFNEIKSKSVKGRMMIDDWEMRARMKMSDGVDEHDDEPPLIDEIIKAEEQKEKKDTSCINKPAPQVDTSWADDEDVEYEDYSHETPLQKMKRLKEQEVNQIRSWD